MGAIIKKESLAEGIDIPSIRDDLERYGFVVEREEIVGNRKVYHCLEKCEEALIRYKIVGNKPRAWIHVGQHQGSESWVSEPLHDVLGELLQNGQLPDCVIIECASPSSAKIGTRENSRGIDTNRTYWGSSDNDIGVWTESYEFIPDAESRAVASIFRRVVEHFGKLLALASFHGDPEEKDSTYAYEHTDSAILPTLEILRDAIGRLGVPLYSGLDEPRVVLEADTATGHFIDWGYVRIPANRAYDGTLEVAAHLNGWLASMARAWVFEIPEIDEEKIRVLIHLYLWCTVLHSASFVRVGEQHLVS